MRVDKNESLGVLESRESVRHFNVIRLSIYIYIYIYIYYINVQFFRNTLYKLVKLII